MTLLFHNILSSWITRYQCQKQHAYSLTYLQAGTIHAHKPLAVELAAQLNLSDESPVLLAVMADAGGQSLHRNILPPPHGRVHTAKAAGTLQSQSLPKSSPQ
jgi:hypothetical protein